MSTRTLIILGGLMGFAIGALFGLSRKGDWPSVFWKSCVAAYGAGLLMRWWGRVWIRSLNDSRRIALEANAAKENQMTESNERNLS